MDRPTLSYRSLFDLFLATREESNCELVTLANYRTAVGRFLDYPLPADPAHLTPDHVIGWMASLRHAGMPAPSRAWYQKEVFAYLHWVYDRGFVPSDPRRGVPRIRTEQRPLPQVTSQDMTRLLTTASSRPRTKQGNRITIEHQRRNLAIVRLLWSSGIRRKELLMLTLDDVDLASREVTVHGKGKKQRRAPFDAATKVAIVEYLTLERGKLPGPLWRARGDVPMTANALRMMLQRLGERSGTKVTPHAFRRGFARYTRRSGLDIAETAALMGHSTLTMTMRYSQEGEHEAALDAYRRLIG